MIKIDREAKIAPNGVLHLEGLPLAEGSTVTVTMEEAAPTVNEERFPYRGKQPYRYDDPLGPALDSEDWEVLH